MYRYMLLFLLFAGCSNKYEEAKNYLANNDLESAKKSCSSISEKSKYYSEAQSLLSKIDSIESYNRFEKAKSYLVQNQFLNAKDSFNAVKSNSIYFDSSKIYLSSIDNIEKEYKAKIEKERILKEKKEKEEQIARKRFFNSIIGKKYIYPFSTDIISKYGSPVTLNGTDNINWIAYFPSGNFTILTTKKTNKIEYIKDGRIPNLRKPINIFNETKALYLELMNFKNRNDFIAYGFAPGYKYHSWLQKVEKYENYPEAKELLSKGIVLGDLKMLGLEYVSSKGKETEYTRITRQNFKDALY